MKDRAMQALYAMALDPISETIGDKRSYGFRKSRSTADAIKQCIPVFAQQNSAQWILEADTEGCFDNINHEWLIQNIPMDKKILRKWLKAGFMSRKVFHQTEHGTPQGGIISPIWNGKFLPKEISNYVQK
jgi:RNA-directed DNA polymerase